VNGLGAEVRAVWRRLLVARLIPILIGASALLIVAARLVAPVPAGPVHSELARLSSGNEVTGFLLMILAFLSAYLLVAPDLHDEFESMTATGGSRPLTFAAARVLAGIGGLLVTTTALGLVVEAMDLGGRYQEAEAVHLGVLFVNSVPIFILALALTCIFGRVAGLIATFVLMSLGSHAAYERGALSDHFIDPNGALSVEQTLAWLAPQPLLDSLPGIALIDQSEILNQFPVRAGSAVWGADLIQVSGPTEITQYALYLLAVVIAFYVVCRFRAARARSRFHLVPSWLEDRRASRADDNG
jgi:hypothetical protein